jgi:hypothetical protein
MGAQRHNRAVMPSPATLPFAIECACGTWARGNRQPKPKVLTCADCGRPVFVFPAVASVFGAAAPVPPAEWSTKIRFWLPPAAAAVLAVTVVGMVIAAMVQGRRPADAGPDVSEVGATNLLTGRLAAARTALEEGSYRLARAELDAGHDLLARYPRALSSEQARQFTRWRRQADLLADLLPESISEIVAHSVGRADKEWDSIFRERYAGKSVVLDARVVRTAAGHYDIDYHLEAAGAVGEWDLDKLRLFEGLPLEQPQRMFFGFRLRTIRRLSRDRWTVIPDADSGVLLTDAVMLNGLSAPADEELNQVMRRQAKWDSDG